MIEDALLFAAVVQAGSFSEAARSKGMAKSQISRNITRLETKLGLKLLKRTTRHLHLTPAGENFYQHCLTIQQTFDGALSQIDEEKNALSGLLKITMPIAIGRMLLLPPLTSFMKKYSEMKVYMDLNDKRIDLENSTYDLAFRLSARIGSAHLIAKKIITVDYCLCGHADFTQQWSTIRTPLDLQKHKLIGVNPNGKIRWHFIGEGAVATNAYSTINDYQSHIDFARRQNVIIKIPKRLAEPYLKNKQLVEILPSFQSEQDALWAVYSESMRNIVKIQHLLKHIQSCVINESE